MPPHLCFVLVADPGHGPTSPSSPMTDLAHGDIIAPAAASPGLLSPRVCHGRCPRWPPTPCRLQPPRSSLCTAAMHVQILQTPRDLRRRPDWITPVRLAGNAAVRLDLGRSVGAQAAPRLHALPDMDEEGPFAESPGRSLALAHALAGHGLSTEASNARCTSNSVGHPCSIHHLTISPMYQSPWTGEIETAPQSRGAVSKERQQ